ncbi:MULTISPECIES: GhoT/OrtT family toxin [Pseudescherichia]|uniref:GhoT/OrtT family toxin n=1 Tax=Pseudescherichia TaxID=2055880 RepID=UPI00301D4CC5
MEVLLDFYIGGVLACVPFHWQLQRNNRLLYRAINTVICAVFWPLLQVPKLKVEDDA